MIPRASVCMRNLPNPPEEEVLLHAEEDKPMACLMATSSVASEKNVEVVVVVHDHVALVSCIARGINSEAAKFHLYLNRSSVSCW